MAFLSLWTWAVLSTIMITDILTAPNPIYGNNQRSRSSSSENRDFRAPRLRVGPPLVKIPQHQNVNSASSLPAKQIVQAQSYKTTQQYSFPSKLMPPVKNHPRFSPNDQPLNQQTLPPSDQQKQTAVEDKDQTADTNNCGCGCCCGSNNDNKNGGATNNKDKNC